MITSTKYSASQSRFGMARAAALVASILLALGLTEAKSEAAPTLVKTMTISETEGGVSRTFFGQISANQSVDLGFQVAGRVVEFNAPEGTVIAAGSVLAKLDQRPFEIEVERARIALQQAERTLARYQKLTGSTISEAQTQDAQTNVDIARVALENAEYALEQTSLIAPFDAVVAMRNVSNFSTVAAGTQVVRLHDLSEVRVDVDVPEVLIQQLGENPNMVLSARLPGSDATYPLSFKEVNAEASQVGQTFRVTLAMNASSTNLLLPGASVTVTAELLDQRSRIKVSPGAIAIDPQGETSIFKLVGDAEPPVLMQVPVELSVAASGAITLETPLPAGTEIVVGGANTLVDGQPVRRFIADFD